MPSPLYEFSRQIQSSKGSAQGSALGVAGLWVSQQLNDIMVVDVMSLDTGNYE